MLSELSSISDIDSCRMMPTSLMCWDLPHYPRLQRFQNLTSCVLSKCFILNPLFDHTLFLLFTNSSKNYIKNLLAMRETGVRPLGWEDPLKKGMATHSSILAWRIPWTV